MTKYNNPFAFDGDLAVQYGDREALLITHFQYWINFNKASGKNFRDGHTWTYQTREAIADHFPFWTLRQVRTLLDSLVKQGVLIKGNYNQSPIDKTVWYAFKNEEMFTMAEKGRRWPKKADQYQCLEPESKPLLRKDNVSESPPPTQKSSKTDVEETLSFARAKGKDTGKTQHPLKKDQKDTYDLLLALGMEADHDCLCALIRMNRINDLLLAISEYQAELDRGTKVKRTRIALFRSILKRIASPEGRNQAHNRSWLRTFCQNNGLRIDLQSKSAMFQNGKELPYSMNHEAFKKECERITGVQEDVF